MKLNYIVVSSNLFWIPAFVAYAHGNNILSATSTCVAIASINYWRNPRIGFRRTIDVITARTACMIYILHVRRVVFLDIHNVLYMMFMYQLSEVYWKYDINYWQFCHILFHCFVVLQQLRICIQR
jgi:hypothetical protein